LVEDFWSMPGVVYTRYLGVVSGRELIESALSKSGDARLDNISYIIGDWTAVERTDISAQDVKELIAVLHAVARCCPKAKNASIVNRNETGLALVAWYRHLGESLPWQLDIFHNQMDAFQFYGLDFEQLQT
jgi:hypothetical protein